MLASEYSECKCNTNEARSSESIHDESSDQKAGQEGKFASQLFEENIAKMDVVVEIELTRRLHAANVIVLHAAVLDAVREKVGIDEF